MAKNKNRKQGGKQHSSAQIGAERAKSPASEAGSDAPGATPGGPTGTTRNKQRRFGHN